MDQDELIIELIDEDNIDISLEESVTISNNHALLDNLDYESSGHIGFAPSRLDNLDEVTDEELDDSNIFVDVNGVDKKIPINKLIDKTDVTVDDEEEMLIFGNKEE